MMSARRGLAVVGCMAGFIVGGSAAAAEWDAVVQKAQAEGTVVLGTNQSIPAFRQDVSSKVKERFGVAVEVRSMNGAELTAIMDRECETGRPSMDVILSGNSEILGLYDRDCLAPVKPLLMLPEVVDGSKWRGGALKFTDPKGSYLLQTAEYVSLSGIYNGNGLSEQGMKSVRSLLDPKLKGKVASFDPRRGGPGRSTASYLLTLLGDQFVKDLYLGQEVVYTTNDRQLADWVARGTYLVGLGAQERAFGSLIEQGLPVKIMLFDDLKPLYTGGSSVLKLVKGAPHPNAAAVVLNWFASKEGQEVFEKHVRQKSRRLDVRSPETPDYMIPKDGEEFHDDYAYENYVFERQKASEHLIKILGR